MATRKTYLERPSYIYLGGEREASSSITSDTDQFEFDESEIWNNTNDVITSESKKATPNSRPMKKPATRKSAAVDRRSKPSSSSLPLNIPDWSKILSGENRRRESQDCFDDGGDDEDDDEDGRMPPHEYLARTRMASLSVHEGVGRTLKGRDLSRVRNAIWKQIGFED